MFGGVYAIITDKKGRILLQHRSKYKFPDGNKWTVLSGKMKIWERPESAIKRELQEELGVVPKKITFIKKMWRFLLVPSYIFHAQLNLQEPVKINEGQAAKYVAEKELHQHNVSAYSKKILDEWNKIRMNC